MLTLAPTPIGNIGDISCRTLELLSKTDILLCEDTRVTKRLLSLLHERHGLEVRPYRFIALHSHNEHDFLDKLTPDFFDAQVVYMSDAGMPGISDPGQMLVRYCIDHGLSYDILPGANAALTAYVASGFLSTKMLFFGFLPHKGGDRSAALNEALYSGYTTVLYESPHRLLKLLDEIAREEGEREICVAKEITKRYQHFYHGRAETVKAQIGADPKGEWVVVIAAGAMHQGGISERDVLELDIPKKAAAKLIAKITGENTKACYQRLLALSDD